jgi:hypothetical protein
LAVGINVSVSSGNPRKVVLHAEVVLSTSFTRYIDLTVHPLMILYEA